tara:strand:- start:1011 stop:1247 length:237 start_codon:yes stop_codon:yes gene_type:complete
VFVSTHVTRGGDWRGATHVGCSDILLKTRASLRKSDVIVRNEIDDFYSYKQIVFIFCDPHDSRKKTFSGGKNPTSMGN